MLIRGFQSHSLKIRRKYEDKPCCPAIRLVAAVNEHKSQINAQNLINYNTGTSVHAIQAYERGPRTFKPGTVKDSHFTVNYGPLLAFT